MRHRILVDGNSVGYSAHQGPMLTAGSLQTQAVFGTIKFARRLKVQHPEASIVFLFDGRSWRKDISDTYKANWETTEKQRKMRADYKAQRPLITRALLCLGVPMLVAANLEADDLAGILSQKFTAQGDHVRLVTGDQDWLQLVNPQVMWVDHRSEDVRTVTHADFTEYTGYSTARQFVQAKALQGDTSDNLPGVGMIGEKGAADLLDVWGDVRTFLADTDRTATYKLKRPAAKKIPKPFDDFAKMPERQDKFWHNMKMMNLLDELPAPEKMTLARKPVDPAGFKSLCHELGFQSIYNPAAFDKWIIPFKGTN